MTWHYLGILTTESFTAGKERPDKAKGEVRVLLFEEGRQELQKRMKKKRMKKKMLSV